MLAATGARSTASFSVSSRTPQSAMTTSDAGRSLGPVLVFSILWTSDIPEMPNFYQSEELVKLPSRILPKTTCRPSSHSVLTVVRKNWLPFVSLPMRNLHLNHVSLCIQVCLTCIGHWQPSSTIMFQFEVFIGEFSTIDAEWEDFQSLLGWWEILPFASSTISTIEITTLNHETLDNTMEFRALVSETLGTSC